MRRCYLLSKAPRYFYDAEAVRTPSSDWHGGRFKPRSPLHQSRRLEYETKIPQEEQSQANLRNVWTIATHAYSEAHFATFPPALVEPCIKAGTSEKGCCVACGGPWERVVKELKAEPRA